MKAKTVYESLFTPKRDDEILNDISKMSLQELVQMSNTIYGYVDENNNTFKQLPLIIQIYIHGRHNWPAFDHLHLSYSLFPKEEKFAELLFRYKTNGKGHGHGINIRQYINNKYDNKPDDFIAFVTSNGHPLWSKKIYNLEDFLDALEENENGEF